MNTQKASLLTDWWQMLISHQNENYFIMSHSSTLDHGKKNDPKAEQAIKQFRVLVLVLAAVLFYTIAPCQTKASDQEATIVRKGYYQKLFGITNSGQTTLPSSVITYSKGVRQLKSSNSSEENRSSDTKTVRHTLGFELSAKFGISKVSSIGFKGSYKRESTNKTEHQTINVFGTESITESTTIQKEELHTPKILPGSGYYVYQATFEEFNHCVNFTDLLITDKPLKDDELQLEITIHGKKWLNPGKVSLSSSTTNRYLCSTKYVGGKTGSGTGYFGDGIYITDLQFSAANYTWELIEVPNITGPFFYLKCSNGYLTFDPPTQRQTIGNEILPEISKEHPNRAIWKIVPTGNSEGEVTIQCVASGNFLGLFLDSGKALAKPLHEIKRLKKEYNLSISWLLGSLE